MYRTSGLGAYAVAEQHGLFLGRTTNPTVKRPVYYCHGYTNQYAADSLESNTFDIMKAIANADIPVVACDFSGSPGGNNAWGNDSSRAKVDTARTFMVSNFGLKNDKILFVTQSGGAPLACAYAKANPTAVAAMVLITPSVDLIDFYNNNRAGLASSISTAYGGAPPSDHSPSTYASSLASIPMQVHYSTDDPYCIPSTVIPFINSSNAKSYSLGSIGHANSTADTNVIVNFLNQYV